MNDDFILSDFVLSDGFCVSYALVRKRNVLELNEMISVVHVENSSPKDLVCITLINFWFASSVADAISVWF